MNMAPDIYFYCVDGATTMSLMTITIMTLSIIAIKRDTEHKDI
jgi:hypothetical protein